jgi:hypothetical protein
VPYRSPDWAQVNASEQAQNAVGEIVSCIGCLNWPQEYRPIRDAAFRSFDAGGSVVWPADEPRATPATEPVTATAEREPDPDWQRVQAYSSYPVDSRDRRSTADAADDHDEIVAAVDEAMDAEEDTGTE